MLDGSAELLLTALAGCDWLGALGVTVMTTVDGTGVSPATEADGVMRMVCTTVAEGVAEGAVTVRSGEETGGGELAGGGDELEGGGGGCELEAGGGGLEEGGGA